MTHETVLEEKKWVSPLKGVTPKACSKKEKKKVNMYITKENCVLDAPQKRVTTGAILELNHPSMSPLKGMIPTAV